MKYTNQSYQRVHNFDDSIFDSNNINLTEKLFSTDQTQQHTNHQHTIKYQYIQLNE